MGCCESCFGRSGGYSAIEEDGPSMNGAVEATPLTSDYVGSSSAVQVPPKPIEVVEATAFHSVPDERDNKKVLNTIDLHSQVFEGMIVEQKFSNKSTYDKKFCWVNGSARTLNLSDHQSKERRHKEASLADVVNVVAGPPEKFKLTPDADGKIPSDSDVAGMNSRRCLSVKFVRGGAIDLRFEHEEERDMWYDVINKLVLFPQQTSK